MKDTKTSPFVLTLTVFRENTVSVKAFVRSESECSRSCSEDPDCGYFRHYSANHTRQPLMCYHLRYSS